MRYLVLSTMCIKMPGWKDEALRKDEYVEYPWIFSDVSGFWISKTFWEILEIFWAFRRMIQELVCFYESNEFDSFSRQFWSHDSQFFSFSYCNKTSLIVKKVNFKINSLPLCNLRKRFKIDAQKYIKSKHHIQYQLRIILDLIFWW